MNNETELSNTRPHVIPTDRTGVEESEQIQGAKAHVIFTDDTDLPYLKILKRGFRHCFVLLNDGKHWIALDPLASHFELTVPRVPPDFDLPRWLQGQGCITAPARITPQKTPALPGLISCVETVKRVLGIRKFWLLTPWQLYRHLVEEEKRLTQISPPHKVSSRGLTTGSHGLKARDPGFRRDDGDMGIRTCT